jgi:hypothetical protein
MCGNCPAGSSAQIFLTLKPGDQIVVLPGAGEPECEEETTEIVHIVSGYSALCASGRRLGCYDAASIKVTTVNHDVYPISEAAQESAAGVEAIKKLKVGDTVLITDPEDPEMTYTDVIAEIIELEFGNHYVTEELGIRFGAGDWQYVKAATN